MKKRIVVIFSSHLSAYENDIFIQHINDTCGVLHSVHCYTNHNQYSLPEVYNKAISTYSSKDAVMVFCHNDIEFDTPDWGKILLKHFNKTNNYQIIGVAGATELNEHGTWWLDKSNQMNFSKMMGIVNHDNGIRKWESKYSEPHFGIIDVLLVDGLFIAVDTEDIEHKFDENYKGFHFYDVSFCFPNYLDGCNIGVITDIRITHKSIGQTNQEWEVNKQQFVEQYKGELPIRVE
jgi:hypothetical protein